MSAEYELPDHALWLDFVFFSGNTWDNNSGKDFRFMLELPSGFKDEDAFFKNLEEIYAERETQARLKKEVRSSRGYRRNLANLHAARDAMGQDSSHIVLVFTLRQD